ncbi:MAG: nitroreductase family deazaflavin-dependent oxidoreductase [Chloroflexi bacterium]|nr:nitroreductase family deazaflavin-dependent oxidoreductase [Chloroflexota bacterium]
MAAPSAPRLAHDLQQLPKYLYRGPMAAVLSRRFVLLLTTFGRRSGMPHQTPLTFMPRGARLVVYAGARRERADWYRNVLAHPEVRVQLGTHYFRAVAHAVEQPAARRELARAFEVHQRRCGPPAPIRWLRRVTGGGDYDAQVAAAFARAEEIPFVELEPIR